MYVHERNQVQELSRDLRAAQERAGLVAPDERTDYFERLVAINVTNLNEYYRLVRLHAGRSYVLAAAASALGFALIVVALAIGLLLSNNTQLVAYVSAAAGVITEMIAGCFSV